jgi:hypothetical protein
MMVPGARQKGMGVTTSGHEVSVHDGEIIKNERLIKSVNKNS